MAKFGIDVSVWQGDFDFNKAKSEGVEFVIIKAGGADGGLYKDSRFEQNYKKAKAAGLGVGAYFFSNATSVAAAQQEAAYFKDCIKGKQFDYPVFCDAETSDMQKLGKRTLTSVISAFCNAMEGYGYWCGIYTNLNWYTYYLDGKTLGSRYSLWLACWDTNKPDISEIQIWQFGGSTNFIRTNIVAGVVCDQDYCYVDYPSKIKAKGLNGYPKASTPATKPAPSTPATKPASSTPKTNPVTFKRGDKVMISKNATIYGSNARFAGFVYNMPFYIHEVNGNRAVFGPYKDGGGVTGAVHTKYLIKV